jgi:hypothetical protein
MQNAAVFCRTALVHLTAWILLWLTWPTEIWSTRLVDLTVGSIIGAIFWFIVSFGVGAALLAFGMNIPARAKQNWWWCHRWLDFAIFVVSAYGIALIVLTKPTKNAGTGHSLFEGFYGFIQVIAGLMWSLVIP